MEIFETISGYWNEFFFAPESMATVGLVRILIGALLLVNIILLFREAQLWYGPNGVLGYGFYAEEFRLSRFSLLAFLPASSRSVNIVFTLHLVSALGLLIGLFTPVSAALAFITLTSIHHRNPLSIHGGDTVLRLMCFLIIFANAGHQYSVDSMLFSIDTGEPQAPWGLRLMQMYIAAGYLKATLWKLTGKYWQNGTAVYYPTQLRIYRRFKLPGFLLTPFSIRVATYTTLIIELMLGTLIWVDDFRIPVVTLGILLHLGIEFVLNVQLFGWTMMVSLLLFLPAEPIEAFVTFLINWF